jgi:hypothetical protein
MAPIATIAVLGALVLAPAAGAQSSGTGYGGAGSIAGQTAQAPADSPQAAGDQSGVAGEVENKAAADSGSVASQATDGNGVLAFTGLDLALLAGGGLILLVTGFGLSRLVGRPEGRA